MRVSVIQQDIIWGSPEDNFKHLDQLLGNGRDAELYVLPEMFTTGFATLEGSCIEKVNPETGAIKGLEWLKDKASEKGAAFAGSVALDTGEGRSVNRLYFVKPDGTVYQYDKRHLFQFGGEHLRFKSGDSRVVVEYNGLRFLLAVCYDLRFPIWLRNRGDYDAILIVANWPLARRFAWDTLLRARAIENQCYVIAANRVGEDPACIYSGGSVIIGPYGEDVVTASDNIETIITEDISIEHLREYEQKFPVRTDADNFEIK